MKLEVDKRPRSIQLWFENLGLSILKKEKSAMSRTIRSIPLCSQSTTDAVISLVESQHCDVILLGASREDLLQNVIRGNIPTIIASQVQSTVILVKGALS